MLVLCSSFTLCFVAMIGYTVRVEFITVLYVTILDEIEFNALNFSSSHPTPILSRFSCNKFITFGLGFSLILSTVLTRKSNGSSFPFFPFTFIFQLVIPIISRMIKNRRDTNRDEREWARNDPGRTGKKGAKRLTCKREKSAKRPETQPLRHIRRSRPRRFQLPVSIASL